MPDPMPTLAGLARARYISVTTYKRTGAGVATPVWFVERDGALCIYSDPTAGKIKRLRRDPRVTVAPCTVSGRLTGPVRPGTARIVTDPAEIAAINAALWRKYRPTRTLLALVERLRHPFARRSASGESVYVVIDPAAA